MGQKGISLSSIIRHREILHYAIRTGGAYTVSADYCDDEDEDDDSDE